MAEIEPRLRAALAAAEAKPEDESLWDDLEELADELQAPDEVGALYRTVLKGSLSAEHLGRIGQRAAGFHEEWFGEDSPHLVEVLKSVLAKDPTLDWPLSRVTVLLTVRERWDELLGLYDDAIRAVEDDAFRRTALLEEALQLAKDFAGQPERAIGYLKQLVELRPHDPQLAANLERFLEREGRYADLVELWRKRLDGADGREYRERIAETYLVKLAAPADALVEAKELATIDGAASKAVALVERALAHADASLEVKRDARAFLVDHYAAEGSDEEAERVLAATLEAETRDGKIGLHRDLAERLAKRGEKARALDHTASILALDPEDDAAESRLRELARETGDANRHAEALVRAAENARPSRRVALLVEAADVRVSASSDAAERSEAEKLYRRVLDSTETSAALRLEVARKLTSLLATRGREADRLAALENLADLEREPSERRRVLGLAAQLAKSLGSLEHALASWDKRLRDDEKDIDALDERIELLTSLGQHEALVASLRDRLELTTSAPVRKDVLRRIATTEEDALDDRPAAIETWRRIAETYGEEPETVDALSRLYIATEQTDTLQALLDRASTIDARRAVDLLVRLSEARRLAGGDTTLVADGLSRALQLDPRHAGARAGLSALIEDGSAKKRAIEALADAARMTDDVEAELGLLEPRLAIAEDQRGRVRLLREAAALEEHRRERATAAFEAIGRALALAPADEQLERELRRLGGLTGLTKEAGAHLAKAGRAISDDALRAAEILRAASELRGDAKSDALDDAALALELVPRDLETALRVVALAGQTKRWNEAAKAWVRFSFAQRSKNEALTTAVESAAEASLAWNDLTVEAESELAKKVEEVLRTQSVRGLRALGLGELGRDLDTTIAAWHRDRRGDETKAMEALSRALVHDDGHTDTLRELARLQWRAPGRPLVDTLLALSERTSGDLDALFDAARIAKDTVQDRALALEVLERLFREASRLWRRGEAARGERPAERTALDAQEQIVSLELAASRHERAIEWLLEGSRLPIAASEARTMVRRAADIAMEKLNDEDRAAALYQQVVDQSLEDGIAIDRLARIYESKGRVPELLALRKRELELDLPGDRKLAVRLEVARLLGHLEDKGGRLDVLRANLAEVPGHEESVRELTTVLDSKGRSAELSDLLVTQAKRLEETDAGRAARLWTMAAKIAEEKLKDRDRAISAYRRVVTLTPTSEVFEALARLYTLRAEPAAAAEWLERVLESTQGPARVETAVRLADARVAAGRLDRAAIALERARAEAPTSIDVRDRLATLYRQLESWEQLAKLLAEASFTTADGAERLALAKEAAALYDQKLGRTAEVVAVLEPLRAELDQEQKSLLAAGYQASGRLADAKELLEAIVTDFGRRRSTDRAQVHYQLGRVARAAGDVKEALEQLDKASSMDMSHAGILRMLGQLAREAEQHERSERAYRALLLVVRKQSPDAEDVEVGASEVLYELSRLAKARGQDTQASELEASAFEAARGSMREATRFTSVLLARHDLALAEKVIELRLAEDATPKRRAGVLLDRATWLAASGKRTDALEARLEALSLAPERVDALPALRSLAKEVGAEKKVVEALGAEAERASEPQLASTLAMTAGEIAENDLVDLESANKLYTKVETIGARTVEAWRALARVAQKQGDRVEEIRVLRRLVQAGVDTSGIDGGGGDASANTDALYRIAEVELRSSETLESGLDTLREALRLVADHGRAASIAAGAATNFPDHEGLLVVWERSARDSGDADQLLSYFVHRTARDGATLDEIREGVTIATSLGEDDKGEAMLVRGIDLARVSLDGLAGSLWIPIALSERRLQANDHAGAIEYAKLAAETAESAGDTLRAIDLYQRLAELAAEGGGDLGAQAYGKLVELNPTEKALWEPAAAAFGKANDRAGFEAVMRRAIDAIFETSARNDARMLLARELGERYGEETDSVTVLREILDEDPDHLGASSILADLYGKRGQNEQLAELLERQLDRARDRNDAIAVAELSLRRGRLLESTQPSEAMEAYRAGLDWAPENADLLRAIYELYGADGDAYDRAAIGERLLAVSSGANAVALTDALVATFQGLDDDDAVGRVLDLGFRRAPSDAGLRTKLEARLTERGDEAALAEVIAFDAAHRTDPTESLARARDAAAAFSRLDQPDRAASVLGEVFRAQPSNTELLDEYVSALIASGRPGDGLDIVSTALDGSEGRGRARVLRTRARLSLAKGDPEAAVRDLDEALPLDPATQTELIDALDALRRVYGFRGEPSHERATTLRLASILVAASQHERSRSVLVEWLSTDADDVDALRALRDSDAAEGRFDRVIETSVRLVRLTRGEEQIEVADKLADAARQAGDPSAAREGLEHVFESQPGAPSVRDALRSLYERTEAHAELAHLLLADAASLEGDAKFDILRRAGELFVYRVGEPNAAIAPLIEARSLREDDAETLIVLADAYIGADALAEAVELLNDAINARQRRRSPALAAMQQRMARIAGMSDDPQTQLEWLKVALETDKGNGAIAGELAELAIKLGDDTTAMNALKVVTLQKSGGPMTKAVAFLRQAQIAHRQGDQQKAVLWARRAKIEDSDLLEAEQFLTSIGEG